MIRIQKITGILSRILNALKVNSVYIEPAVMGELLRQYIELLYQYKFDFPDQQFLVHYLENIDLIADMAKTNNEGLANLMLRKDIEQLLKEIGTRMNNQE